MSLFEFSPVVFDLPDADVQYHPNWLSADVANDCFNRLHADTPWRQDDITVFGRQHAQPRLTALYGNEGKPYGYSGIVMQPNRWTPLLAHLKEQVEAVCGVHFTTVLLNCYRDGRDSNGWHADNEKELGRDPVIASLSLGAARSFHLRHNSGDYPTQKILLEHGSLLLMRGATQHHWKHQIPKTAKPVGPRINLTFRTIK
ncbi:alpha-ketoglutarate-dependent dioxygenase AlkB family protein [Flavobacterium caeni]|uniref:Alkylated DNA repair dioxygenase AlkB n=1 Tax=Flavobacterium caeni TaxID=490189 RepID=A0A1G5FRI5_9FLAO|nr:alpha-ketoglutarate-dependent dioxygenase AlkB [Flavobacterium caeni]SCY41208.1 Alkylated DNA repair dioxygenase AlkB [Flavobacterium caeni]